MYCNYLGGNSSIINQISASNRGGSMGDKISKPIRCPRCGFKVEGIVTEIVQVVDTKDDELSPSEWLKEQSQRLLEHRELRQ